MLLEFVAKIGLIFSMDPLLAGAIILGYLWGNEKIFARAAFLLAFTMIYNMLLKSIWQVPLLFPLEGWAFPSGHMHCAVIFWGYFACIVRQFLFSAFVFLILCLDGYALVYYGYHYPMDILGAVAFGSLSLLGYFWLEKSTFFREKFYRQGALLATLGTGLIWQMPEIARKPHVWKAYGILLGLTLGCYWWQRQGKSLFSVGEKGFLLGIASSGIALIFFLVPYLPLAPKELIFTKFFMLALWISTCKWVVTKLPRREGNPSLVIKIPEGSL